MKDGQTPQSRVRFLSICVASGLFTGILAGLVGLGGAEERVPFILYGLGASLNDMIVANLVISFATSGVNFALRAQAGFFTSGALTIAAAMTVGSLLGAYAGSSVAHRVSERKLKALLALVLSLVVLRLSISLIGGINYSFPEVPSSAELPLAALFGLLIGVIAGAVGVAGGEYRIPVLVFVFGLGIKLAGTTSQLVSLPTIMVALYKHGRLGFMSRQSLRIAATMGAASVVGAIIGTRILVSSSEDLVEVVFAIILLYTISRLVLELRERTSP